MALPAIPSIWQAWYARRQGKWARSRLSQGSEEVRLVAGVEGRPARIVHDGSADQRVLSARVIDTGSLAPSPGVSSPCFGGGVRRVAGKTPSTDRRRHEARRAETQLHRRWICRPLSLGSWPNSNIPIGNEVRRGTHVRSASQTLPRCRRWTRRNCGSPDGTAGQDWLHGT